MVYTLFPLGETSVMRIRRRIILCVLAVIRAAHTGLCMTPVFTLRYTVLHKLLCVKALFIYFFHKAVYCFL